MTNQQAVIIKQAIKALNSQATNEDLLDFVVAEVADRVLLYLNAKTLDDNLLRVVARVGASVYASSTALWATGKPEQAIGSISDNGQSISYQNGVKTYLATASDNALFTGFEDLLKPYRRVNVIT